MTSHPLYRPMRILKRSPRPSEQSRPDHSFLPFDLPPIVISAFNIDRPDRTSTRSNPPPTKHSTANSFGPFSPPFGGSAISSGHLSHSDLPSSLSCNPFTRTHEAKHQSMRLPILPPPPNSEGKARNGRGGIDLDGWEWDGDLVDPAQVSASTKRSHPFTSPFPLPDAPRPPPPVNVSTSTLVVAEVERQGKQRSKSLCPIRSWREKRKMSRGPTTSSVSLQQPQIPPHDHHSAHPPARNLKSMPSITETPVPPVPAKQLPQVYQTLDTWVRRDAPPQVPPRSIDRVWAPTRPQARDPQSRPEAWRELSDMSGMNHPGGVRVPLVLVSESLQQSPSTTARSIEVMATEQDKR